MTKDLFAKLDPSLSRDGSRLAYSAFGGIQKSSFEVRLKDLAGGDERIIPMNSRQYGQTPRISPDGSALSYRDSVEGSVRTFIVKDKETSGREVCDSCFILGFFADPNFALVREKEGRQLLRYDIATGERTVILEVISGRIVEPALSPDDRWLAFVLNKPDGRVAMYIAPLSGSPAAMPAAEKDWVLLFEDDRYLGSPGLVSRGEPPVLSFGKGRRVFSVGPEARAGVEKSGRGHAVGLSAHARRHKLEFSPGQRHGGCGQG